jgi:hypothetical protein
MFPTVTLSGHYTLAITTEIKERKVREYRVIMTGPGIKFHEIDINIKRLSFQDAVQWAYLERHRQGLEWRIHSVSETKKESIISV